MFAAVSQHQVVTVVFGDDGDGLIDGLIRVEDHTGLLLGKLFFFAHEINSQLALLADERFLFLFELRTVWVIVLADHFGFSEKRFSSCLDIFLSLGHLSLDRFHVGVHGRMLLEDVSDVDERDTRRTILRASRCNGLGRSLSSLTEGGWGGAHA